MFQSPSVFPLAVRRECIHARKDTYTHESVAGKGRGKTASLAWLQHPKPWIVPLSLYFIATVVCNCLQFHCRGLGDHRFDFFGEGGKFDLQIIFWQYILISLCVKYFPSSFFLLGL